MWLFIHQFAKDHQVILWWLGSVSSIYIQKCLRKTDQIAALFGLPTLHSCSHDCSHISEPWQTAAYYSSLTLSAPTLYGRSWRPSAKNFKQKKKKFAFSNLLESGYHAGVHFQTDSLGTNSPIHELFDLHRTAVITWGSCGFWVVQHMREC